MFINSTLFLDPAFCHSTLVLIISSVLWALLWSYKLHVLSLWTFFSPSSCLRTDAKLRSFYYNIPFLGSAPPSQANIVGLLQRSNSTAFSIKKTGIKFCTYKGKLLEWLFNPMLAREFFLGVQLVMLTVRKQLNYAQIWPMGYLIKFFLILYWDPIVILELKIRLA